jgi:hypothetical protein
LSFQKERSEHSRSDHDGFIQTNDRVSRQQADARWSARLSPTGPAITVVAPPNRSPYQQMVDIAESYFEAIECRRQTCPFAQDIVRRENGGQTTHNAKPVPWPVPLGSKQADDVMAYIGTLS